MIFAQSSIEVTAGEALIKSLPVTGPIIVILVAAIVLLFRAYTAAKAEQIADLKTFNATILTLSTQTQTTVSASATGATRVADGLEKVTTEMLATRERLSSLESTVANKIRTSGIYQPPPRDYRREDEDERRRR